MNDPIVLSNVSVQRTCDFCGKLTTEHEIQTSTIEFVSPVLDAKVIAKHECGREACSAVENLNVNGNVITIKMRFTGKIGSQYDTAIVVNVSL